MTAPPINLATVRLDAEGWNRWHPPDYTAEHAAVVLALIDAAEAAHAVYNEIGGIGDRASGCGECPPTVDAQERLHDALQRFTFEQP